MSITVYMIDSFKNEITDAAEVIYETQKSLVCGIPTIIKECANCTKIWVQNLHFYKSVTSCESAAGQ
jgi:hypothetical protein